MQTQNKNQTPSLRKEKRSDGCIAYVVGRTRSGKTTWMRQQTANDDSVLVWDGKAEWGAQWGYKVITHPRDLQQYVMPGATRARVSYRVPVTRENFATFCALAWVYSRAHGGVIIVDELADVTTPAKAPVNWGEIVRKSGGWGTRLYAGTQRPQEVDKTVQGNAAIFHCGMMSDSEDAKYVARRLLNIDVKRVEALGPLQFIERDVRTGTIRAGKVNPKSRR
jgi:hypothetical protein